MKKLFSTLFGFLFLFVLAAPSASALTYQEEKIYPIINASGDLIFTGYEDFDLNDIDNIQFDIFQRDFYAQKLLLTFTEEGAPNSTTLDNDNLGDAEFDFQSYVSHQCYNIEGTNVVLQCLREFGPFADLKDTLQNGTLSAMLESSIFIGNQDRQYDERSLAILTDIIEGNAPDFTVDDDRGTLDEYDPDDETFVQNTRNRSDYVWDICKTQYGEEHEDACYISNVRFISDTTIPLAPENIVYRPKSY